MGDTDQVTMIEFNPRWYEKKSKEQRKMKKVQRKKEKGARGYIFKRAGSKRLITERSREQGPPYQRLRYADYNWLYGSSA